MDTESALQWQDFYNNASRLLFYERSGQFNYDFLQTLPTYEDLQT
jgi:hypothetical protein